MLVVGLLCLWVYQATRQRRTIPFLTLTFFATVTHLGDAVVQWALGAIVALLATGRPVRRA